MSFVNVSLLAGTALIAIPIVLHLTMRRKPRHFEFPAIRFVQKRHEVNQRRLRLRHLLLLALRVLAIALLALALARPSVSVKYSGILGSREAPVAAALVFDTSKRMEYQHDNRTRLDAARELGLWLVAQLPRDSRIAVMDTGPGPAAFQVDRGGARHRIERLSTVAHAQPLTATLDEAARLLAEVELPGEGKLARREIYVFTDMARVSWSGELAARLQHRLSRMPDVGIYLIDVGVDDPTNTALGELRLSAQVLSSRSPLRIETEVFHRGPGGERTIELYLPEADSENPRKGRQIVPLEPGAGQPVRFEIGWLEVGTHQGYVEIVGQDGLACDDRRFFTVRVRPAWRILIAAPKPPERFALYLAQMLAPESYRRSGQARFECNVIALDELTGHGLEPYSAVCLLDPTPLAPATWEKLSGFVSEGRGLAIFLGRKANAVESFNRPQAQKLLPAKLLRQARRPDGDLHLAPQDFQHPILADFRDHAEAIPWQDMPVFRYWQLDKPRAGVDVVVAYNDGRPAILERPVGTGRVLTVTTPVSDDPNQNPWNLLPVGIDGHSWPFFILTNLMASYLVGSSDQQLNYYAGQTAVVKLDPRRISPTYTLIAPDASGEMDVRLEPDPQDHVLVVTSTDRLGNYRIRSGESSAGEEYGFSVNLAREQTRLDRISEEELADVFGTLAYRVARDRNQLEGDRSLQRVGRELFAILILLVAAALSIEHVLANRFYRE